MIKGMFNNLFTVVIQDISFANYLLKKGFEDHVNWTELITQDENYKIYYK